MGLFSKEECCFCNQKVGMLSRKKMKDKKFICKDCEKNCSSFINFSKFDSEFIKDHFEYMKKQDMLYKKEFATIPEDEKISSIYQFNGLVFADSIAMFEVITSKTEKQNYKELFRYDQIKDYDIYTVLNTQEGGKKYSEVGVEINLYCKEGLSSVGMTEYEKEIAHPYVDKIKIYYGKNVDNDLCVATAIHHLDEIFMKEPRFKTLGRNIKEAFTGTATDKRNMQQGVDALKALGGLAKAKLSGDEDAIESAKANMKNNLEDIANSTTGNRAKYKEIADATEKRAWKE